MIQNARMTALATMALLLALALLGMPAALAADAPYVYAQGMGGGEYAGRIESMTVLDSGAAAEAGVHIFGPNDISAIAWSQADVAYYRVAVRDVRNDTVVVQDAQQQAAFFDVASLLAQGRLSYGIPYKIGVGAIGHDETQGWSMYYFMFEAPQQAPAHSEIPTEPAHSYAEPVYVPEPVPAAQVLGEFFARSLTVQLGDIVQVSGMARVQNGVLERVTLTVDGHYGDDENNRYATYEASGADMVSLDALPQMVINTNLPPFHVPGEYTVHLNVRATDGTWAIVDSMFVSVVAPPPAPAPEIPAFSEEAQAPAHTAVEPIPYVETPVQASVYGELYTRDVVLHPGESLLVEGVAGVLNGLLERVTLTIPGYFGDEENARYATHLLQGSTDIVMLHALPEMVVDTGRAPFNVPGEYLLCLNVKATDGTWAVVDQTPVTVIGEISAPAESIPAHSEIPVEPATQPAVALYAPGSGDTYATGQTLHIAGRMDGNLSGLVKILHTATGYGGEVEIGTGDFALEYPLSEAGEYQLTVTASSSPNVHDPVALRTETTVAFSVIDPVAPPPQEAGTPAPAVALVSPSPGETLTVGVPTDIMVTAAHFHHGTIRLLHAESGIESRVAFTDAMFSIPFTAEMPGTYDIIVTAFDSEMENDPATRRAEATASLYVQDVVATPVYDPLPEKPAPEISLLSPSPGDTLTVGVPFDISVHAANLHHGVIRLLHAESGIENRVAFTDPSFSILFTAQMPGSYDIVVTAFDSEMESDPATRQAEVGTGVYVQPQATTPPLATPVPTAPPTPTPMPTPVPAPPVVTPAPPPPATDDDALAALIVQMIKKNETGMNYGRVSRKDGNAMSIGACQWNASRALGLLQAICTQAPQEAREILGDSLYNEVNEASAAQWNTRTASESEAPRIQQLLLTPTGIASQEALILTDVRGYIQSARGVGITDPLTMAYYADMRHVGGAYANQIARDALSRAANSSEPLLDHFHAAAAANPTMGTAIYASRRNSNYALLRADSRYASTAALLPPASITYQDGDRIAMHTIGDLLVMAWKPSAEAVAYKYNMKLLDGEPVYSDNEPGAPLSASEYYTGDHIAIPKYKLAVNKWVKFAICSIDKDGNTSDWATVCFFLQAATPNSQRVPDNRSSAEKKKDPNENLLDTYVCTGNYCDDLLGIAFTQKDYQEYDGTKTKYGHYTGTYADDWCAAFISWCAKAAGIPDSIVHNNTTFAAGLGLRGTVHHFLDLKTLSARQKNSVDENYLLAYFREGATNAVYYANKESFTPQRGDLILFYFAKHDQSQKYVVSHVGIVYEVDEAQKKVYYIEGNAGPNSNRVDTCSKDWADASIRAYVRPAY